MNIFNRLLLITLLIPSQALLASQPPIPSCNSIDSAIVLGALENPKVVAKLASALKNVAQEPLSNPNETAMGNLKEGGALFIQGWKTMALAGSRLWLDSNRVGNNVAEFFAKNCWAIAATGATAGFLYFYVWPRLAIDVSWSNHRFHKPARDNQRH